LRPSGGGNFVVVGVEGSVNKIAFDLAGRNRQVEIDSSNIWREEIGNRNRLLVTLSPTSPITQSPITNHQSPITITIHIQDPSPKIC
jgi:hypothetical protein